MMRRSIAWAALALIALAAAPAPAGAQTPVRVGWCAKTVSSAAAPFAIATKLGWYEKEGIKVEVVPLPGSTDCVKLVATRELLASLPSAEPLAIIRPQGVQAKFFYTAYQSNIYGIAVPADSPVKTITDLKGKKIGVTSMASAGVIVARALTKQAGMDPDKDVSIVVAGESAQTAALLNSKQIEALSQFDTQYALTENAGAKLRLLDHPEIKKFPSNGFVALEESLKDKRKELVAMAKGYAMGTVFAIANPEAATLRDDLLTLEARARNWRLEPVGAKTWGDNVEQNYQAYMDWLLAQGVIKVKTEAKDVITNDLIGDINKFDPTVVAAEAKAYKAK
jgi:NitT/TauT family transport system substrate-binding protein